MEFYTTSTTKRPKRLSARTRKWANFSMRGKFGDEAFRTPFLTVENEEFDKWNAYDRYDYAIDLIAKNAPLRVLDEELICGSATLGTAIYHVIPIKRCDEHVFSSVSHLTIDFETTLKKGVTYYEEQIKARMKDDTLSPLQMRFLESLLNTINSLKIYHARYLEATKDAKPEVYNNLLQVPFSPARNFHEAVQSLWFIFSFVRLCGNWPGIGRIDYLLGSYLENDLKEKTLTIPKAREILASLFIKGTEWIVKDTPKGTGDAQHYQNIVLAGVDENGKEVTNKVTYLVLDIIEELGISDFPITVRVNENTPKKLLEKVAKVIRHGGVVAVYNEPLILNSMVKFGYDLNEARTFANDGCWEVQVPGKTFFSYSPFDSLELLQKVTLKGYENVNFSSFESLYKAYIADLDAYVCEIVGKRRDNYTQKEQASTLENFAFLPTSVVALFENGCIEKACSYYECGPAYNVISPHIGGLADTVNSLYAIKKLVFDEKKISFSSLLQTLKNNWENAEELRAYIRKYKFYGTDNDEVDLLYKTLLHDFYLICNKLDKQENKPYRIPAGVSTFGREIDWLPKRLASAHGTKEGTILAGNTSPTPGTDTEGATAVIKSYCKADLTEMVTGAALDIKLSPRILDGEKGVQTLQSLILAFINLGGFFLQIDTVDSETLRKAQGNPQEYKTLSVRVSGWNARFITLTKEWQNMVIQRTEHNK